jgi:hypothetical protein
MESIRDERITFQIAQLDVHLVVIMVLFVCSHLHL